MVQAVRMPMMGNTMESGHLIEWKIDEGDDVSADDVIVIVESEKTTGDVAAEQDGALERIDVEEGESVPPGTVLGVVLGPDEELSEAPAPRSRNEPNADDDQSADSESVSATASDDTATTESADSSADPADSPTDNEDQVDTTAEKAQAVTVATERTFASPSTRRLAREHGLSLDSIDGTGIGGRVTESDVRKAAGEITQASTTATAGQGLPADATASTTNVDQVGVTVASEQQLSGTRETIAKRMSRSAQEAPHVTLNREVAVERAFETAEELSQEAAASVGFTDMLIAASVRALDAHPVFNAWFEDRTVRRITERNVAVAVDADSGLVTPVIRTAGERTLADIAAERERLTTDVLEGEFTMSDLQGGTFTITNLGMFGIDSFDPIINPPQVAILGVGRVRNGDDGRTCTLSLSFDHRVVDGADAARFLDTLTTGLEAPSLAVADRTAAGADSSDRARSASEPATVSESVAADIEATAHEVADAHDWPVPSFNVELTDGTPSVTVDVPERTSPATMKRLTYAACRESSYAETIVGIRDPELKIR